MSATNRLAEEELEMKIAPSTFPPVASVLPAVALS